MLLLALPGLALAEDLPTDRAHAFYYGWYGNPDTDGVWRQWNHAVAARTPDQEHTCVPPHDIGANFYPAHGLYSSNDPETLAIHMAEMRRAGVGVVALSWWGKNKFTDKNVEKLLDAAQEEGLKVCFHVEPFGGRNANTFRDALAYIVESYGDHPALYRVATEGNRLLLYIYDSYLTPATEWAEVLTPEGSNTIRGTELDAVVIGLWVKSGDGIFMRRGGFDGFYTYFASDGFTYGSTWANWPDLAAYAEEHDLLFIPSVAPGYEDRKIRPWNGRNTRERENGAYYDKAFQAAIEAKPGMISITSYNEWHEGTQIEPATPYEAEGVTYLDYGNREPDWYLDRTRHWLKEYIKATQTND
jgi:glycoprotein endo-alpha-1,2-mannosidase